MAPSESHWVGKSEDAPSSADVNITEVGSHVSGMAGPAETAVYVYNQVVREEVLEDWFKKLKEFEVLPQHAPAIVPEDVQRLPPQEKDTHMGEWVV
ncbi:hypothetical protein C0991_003809 [Blastosporella zonata]|nr:hypothetical protein C0991_003809 [Blastosporella zonata]